jgi:hypothetical protein
MYSKLLVDQGVDPAPELGEWANVRPAELVHAASEERIAWFHMAYEGGRGSIRRARGRGHVGDVVEEEDDLGVTGWGEGSGALLDLSGASRGGNPAPVERREHAAIARVLNAVDRLFWVRSRHSVGRDSRGSTPCLRRSVCRSWVGRVAKTGAVGKVSLAPVPATTGSTRYRRRRVPWNSVPKFHNLALLGRIFSWT